MRCILLAPGPSMSAELANEFARTADTVGVIGVCFELAPWADFLVANDIEWWAKYPAAWTFPGRKFSANEIACAERVCKGRSDLNSGTLALEVAVMLGHAEIDLYGFDMHGSHYFGPYTNGLKNTPEHARRMHFKQYRLWRDAHPEIRVRNCTAGSALTMFEMTA
jgi:hypothetical protein